MSKAKGHPHNIPSAGIIQSPAMKMSIWKYALAAVLIVVVVLAAGFGAWWWMQRQWFDLQAQQLATIERIGAFPPEGQDRERWKNALVTPYNVWGNVTYHPNYSHISNDEMRSLQASLEEIVATTTPENSIESVDRVFQLLLTRGQKTEFISGYRDEFRTHFETARASSQMAEPSSNEMSPSQAQ